MLRSILAVIASYIAMAILIIAVFSALMIGLGPNRLLKPGAWEGNMFLTITAPSLTIVAGLFGGWLCTKIARKPKPVIALAVLVLVLGFVTAYSILQKPFPTGPRDPNLTTQQFMEQGREPTWLAISNPILGAGAVLIGGLCLAAKRKTQ